MNNPVLLVQNAGFGDTPLPSDALLKPGDTLNIIDKNDGTERPATILAVVPAGVPIEYAVADQAEPKKPRPLMVTKALRVTSYAIQHPAHGLIQVKQGAMFKGLTAACPDCMGTGRGSATDGDAKCETCAGRGRRDVRSAEGVKP